MIDTRWFSHAPVKPGRQPDPEERVKAIRKPDPPELIETCLNCPLPECRRRSLACPFYGMGIGKSPRGSSRKDNSTWADEEKIRDMLRAGWRDEPLCRELGITAQELKRAKRRLRWRGLL